MSGMRESATYCFNSRTHAGCDFSKINFKNNFTVSIHAPTRGATIKSLRPLPKYGVSIHAPTRGATVFTAITEYALYGFNSRTHAGCDTVVRMARAMRLEFQFTHPRGVRQVERRSELHTSMFQFTHPRGVRHLHPDCNLRVLPRFNSRTHAGCDFRRLYP